MNRLGALHRRQALHVAVPILLWAVAVHGDGGIGQEKLGVLLSPPGRGLGRGAFAGRNLSLTNYPRSGAPHLGEES